MAGRRSRDFRRAVRKVTGLVQPVMVRTVAALRELLGAGTGSLGFVPTMGALHEGHLQLVRHSRAQNDRTVVSVFVNPSQFNNPDDLARYPRTESADVALLAQESVDIVFAPDAAEMYPEGFSTWVTVEGVTDVLEGVHRPGHFRGVATVVTLLLRMVQPHRAYLGEKDWQQLLVVRQLARDLHLDVEIVGVPTVRAADGLALSSRNVRLSAEARRGALVISAGIAAVQRAFASGEHHIAALEATLRNALATEPLLRTEYAVVVHATTLRTLEQISGPARVLVAAEIGGVRLIDNGPLSAE